MGGGSGWDSSTLMHWRYCPCIDDIVTTHQVLRRHLLAAACHAQSHAAQLKEVSKRIPEIQDCAVLVATTAAALTVVTDTPPAPGKCVGRHWLWDKNACEHLISFADCTSQYNIFGNLQCHWMTKNRQKPESSESQRARPLPLSCPDCSVKFTEQSSDNNMHETM